MKVFEKQHSVLRIGNVLMPIQIPLSNLILAQNLTKLINDQFLMYVHFRSALKLYKHLKIFYYNKYVIINEMHPSKA